MEIDRGFLTRLLANDLAEMGFDLESGEEVVEALCESVVEYLPQLRGVVGTSGMSEIGFFAHALKGTLKNFSAPQFVCLTELFQALEKEAKGAGSMVVIDDLMAQVEGEMKAFLPN